MRLEVKYVNYTKNHDWLFKLSDSVNEYYIFDDSFYYSNGLKSPITKKELDYLDVGVSIWCEVKDFDGIKVVTKIT